MQDNDEEPVYLTMPHRPDLRSPREVAFDQLAAIKAMPESYFCACEDWPSRLLDCNVVLCDGCRKPRCAPTIERLTTVATTDPIGEC